MSTPEQRRAMAQAIVNFEARRQNGHLAVYKLPKNDGGGRYEVAGINERYNKSTCDTLVTLIGQGRYDQAETLAVDFIAQDTDRVASWSTVPAVESYLRDSCFNRGFSGSGRILQRALGVKDDGAVGQVTRAALAAAERDGMALLTRLRAAREDYERKVVGYRANLWKGLVNRWDKALDVAKMFPTSSTSQPIVVPPPAPVEEVTLAPVVASVDVAIGPPVAAPVSAPPAVLPALRSGMQGERIAAWQSFLRGRGFEIGVIDGKFGEHTRDATKAFQKKAGLDADGVAGRQTLLKAAALGFELIEEPAPDNTSSNFPPPPVFPRLASDAQRQALFGRFSYVSAPVASNPEAIRVLGTWAQDNIVSVPLPQLRKALGKKMPAAVQFHRLAAKQLQGLWEDWEEADLLNRVLSWEGSYVARYIRGSRTVLSNHAFGTAFDINASYNGLGQRPALVGQKGCVRELVQIANQWGFYWGGHFGGSRSDGMHFEVAFIKN